jgi:G3E family GTPase
MFFASTGSGKSTFVANSAHYLAFVENKKVLIIVNEESTVDVGARISCLHRGYSIHKFRRGTQAYPQFILDEISDLTFLSGKINIYDAAKSEAMVRSFEGIMKLIEQAKLTYDVIFIDYYQNIDRSLADPIMNAFEAQARFASRVDIAKNNAKCPIILMGQIRKTDDDFEQRIKGRKLIVDKCTDVFELVVEKEKSRTTMKIHKDRWGGKQGEEVYLGYEDGFLKFYNDDFEERALEKQRQYIDSKFNNSSTTTNEEDEDD